LGFFHNPSQVLFLKILYFVFTLAIAAFLDGSPIDSEVSLIWCVDLQKELQQRQQRRIEQAQARDATNLDLMREVLCIDQRREEFNSPSVRPVVEYIGNDDDDEDNE
jgi:hypothetical protein